MGIEAIASLIVASADLNVVTSVINAIRTADITSAAAAGSVSPVTEYAPRLIVHPEPRYEPRPIYHPTPIYAARPVIHPHPRVASIPPVPCSPCDKPAYHEDSLLQPPWKIVPWKEKLPAPVQIKIRVARTDIPSTGSIIDIFI